MLRRLLFGKKYERKGFELYHSCVAIARTPSFYLDFAVPDTLDGRFDLIGLFTAILIRRLRRMNEPGPALAQAVFDAMFTDIDRSLREIGAADVRVARSVKAMWEAFHGRALSYESALDAGDAEALRAAVERNIWRGEAAEGSGKLADVAASFARRLDGVPETELLAGHLPIDAPELIAA